MFEKISNTFKDIQNKICDALVQASGTRFQEDLWSYEHGEGGGATRIFSNDGSADQGAIEKGGVNFSSVSGKLNPKIATKMKIDENSSFKACGVSLVIHPLNPMVPTTHANIRHFETDQKWWFGGGIDLTPYYLFKEDAVHFHQTMKGTCDKWNKEYYPKFKKQCDEYFYLPHRDETRGVGGIFYDYLNTDLESNFGFSQSVGEAFIDAYVPILTKKMNMPYNQDQKEFQLFRRGRYVEFNLLYDRGTLFGLETKGRVESILMSLPPTVKWLYNYHPATGSKEAELYEHLKPINWLGL